MPNLPSDTEPDVAPAPTDDLLTPKSEAAQGAYSVSGRTKYALVGLIIVLSFFAAYGFASARSRTASAPVPVAGAGGAACAGGESACGQTGDQAAAQDACADCETEAPAETPQGAAIMGGDVQRIDVDVSQGYFNPTIIEVAAGVPTEISFGQGSGCLSEVEFPQFDIAKDLTKGGAVVTLPALDPGEYQFNCGMQMVFGAVVAK